MLKIKPTNITDLASLRCALQNAIELEHSTMPPYLTAYYTLRGTSAGGAEARRILHSIIIEEMLHMQLACNILNAIGGAPVINAPKFIPNYPGPLPMGIGGADGLVVGIKRYSKATVQNTFMEIEEPENPIHIPVKTPKLEAIAPSFETIGQFYTAIGDEITKQTNTIFTGDPGRQVPGATIVKDVDSALQAIATIVTQGEGTPTSPTDSSTEYAHYYRFEELFMGMRIVVDPSSSTGYSFDPKQSIVVDDLADVTQMADNPRTIDMSSNWRAGQLANECDAIYTKLLNALHIGFNGQPDWIDRNAVSVMFEFKNCIEELLQQQLADGFYAGPRFLYAGP
ncbi:ferritin-like protein [Mesorhizobium sp. M0664]|uniref:ferritin-like domain-containing protein n=1 Tax=Mesorhizobium sp. M0664 TaxID=2956982 RepID=UPI003338086F